MSPTTQLGRKFDADSIPGIIMDVRARLGVRWEETRPSALFCNGESPYFELGAALLDFWMSEVPIKTRFAHPEGSWGCANRLGSVQGGKSEA